MTAEPSEWRMFGDQTRRISGRGGAFQDDQILIATDFECGNGENLRRDGKRYVVDLELEPGDNSFSGKSYYFCCGIQNLTNRSLTIELQLNASIDGQFESGTRSIVLRCGEKWSQLPVEDISPIDGKDAVVLTLQLPPDASPLFVSNFHWHPHTELVAWVEKIRSEKRARVSEIGHSVEGRSIHCIELGREEPDAPTVIMSQTPQPSEGIGTYACKTIAEYLLGGSEEAKSILSSQRIIIVPGTNPDGTVLGLGVSHPNGRFPYFEGKLTADGDDESLPEMRAVWDLLVKEKPWWFIEWHGNNWNRRPGHMLLRYRPHLLADAHARQRWEQLDEKLLALPHTHHGNWTDHEEGMYQVSIGFQAVTRLGCIAHMIKQHDKFTINESCRHAIECLHCGIG